LAVEGVIIALVVVGAAEVDELKVLDPLLILVELDISAVLEVLLYVDSVGVGAVVAVPYRNRFTCKVSIGGIS
jgi:hypothetical protein